VSAHAVAERFVTSAVLLSIPVGVCAEITHDELAERIDTTILLFFAFEIAARIVYAIRREHFESTLVIDAAIVLLALSGLPIMRVARLAHLSRHVHVGFARGIRVARLAIGGAR
jgi:hypothetical protein